MKLRGLIDADGHCEIPDGVTVIGASAFWGCTSLKSVRIPDGVKVIGASAFEDCTSLKSVRIPDGVKVIGASAFLGCTSLPHVKLAQHVAYRVDRGWWHIGCKCAKLPWWESQAGRDFARQNGYTDEEIEQGLAAMKAATKESEAGQ
jgi:hypothetical protein